jgi:hypothetical protein
MDPPDSAGMAFRIGHASSLFRLLYLLEQKGRIAFFDAQAIMQSVVLQRLDGRRIRTPAVCGDNALAGWGVLAQFDDKPFGGIACTSIFVRPIVLSKRFRPQGNHGTHVGMDERGAQHLMRRRDRTVTRPRAQTRGPVQARGGKIPRAIEGSEVVTIETPHRCKRLATLAVPKDALEDWAEPLG